MTGPQQPAEHSLTMRKPYFDLIASGAKTVEVRVGYPKIRRITAGDMLRITCADQALTTRVIAVNAYDSFAAMLDAENPAEIGGPDMSHAELVTVIRDIYPSEKEALGVFALHLVLIRAGGEPGFAPHGKGRGRTAPDDSDQGEAA